MKKLLATVSVAIFLTSGFAFAAEESMSAGNWACKNSDGEQVAVFYLRKDGSSKTVQILNQLRSEIPGKGACFTVDLYWLRSKRQVDGLFCCPWYPF